MSASAPSSNDKGFSLPIEKTPGCTVPVVSCVPGTAPMTDGPIEAKLIDHEKQYWQAIKDKDVNAAMKLPDTLESARNTDGRFLDEFGRGDRDTDARSNDTSIAQALSLMNDQTVVVNRIHRATANSTVAKVLASTTDPGSIADQLYMATLSRSPHADERQMAIAFLRAGTLAQRAEDLQWVLINSLEFLFD